MARSGLIYGDTEVWKAIPHADGFVASSYGRIARLVGHKSANGYIHVEMPRLYGYKGHSVGAKAQVRHKCRVYAHHLVAFTFIGPPPVGTDRINHKDSFRANNRPENLEWCNQSYNLKHGWAMRKAKAS